jgi:SGNH domain (fused to AT3 domains)
VGAGARVQEGNRPIMPRWPGLRGAPLALVAVLALLGWSYFQPNQSQDGAEPRALRARPSEPMQPRAMAADGPPRVLIFGDSIADQAGSSAAFALEEVGIETRLMTLWGQGLFGQDEYDMGRTNPEPPDGTMMASASHAVADFDPDVVAVYTNHNYWPPYPRDADGRTIEEGSLAFASMARTQLSELVRRLSSGGAAVYLVEPIPEHEGETAADNTIWNSYLSVRQELGLGVIEAGDAVASRSGGRVETMPDCAGRSTEVRPAGDVHLTYEGAGRVGTELARQLAGTLGVPPQGIQAPTEAPATMLPLGTGYRLVTCDGATFPFGVGASAFGRLDLGAARPEGEPIVASVLAPPGDRVWAVTSGGHVAQAGGAPLLGDATLGDGERAVGIAATSTGRGYWIATSQGQVQAFGDAEALAGADSQIRAAAGSGSEGEAAAGAGSGAGRDPVVAMAGTPDRQGYWLLHESGRVAAFGTAADAGDLRSDPPDAPLVTLAPHPSGDGYWILDRSGGVHGFGEAEDRGSAGDQPMVRLGEYRNLGDYDTEPVPPTEFPTDAVALLPTVSGDGYWVWLDNGAVCRFGDADRLGGIHRAELDEVMLFLGLPYYAEGPCAQHVGFGSVSDAQIDASQEVGEAPVEP